MHGEARTSASVAFLYGSCVRGEYGRDVGFPWPKAGSRVVPSSNENPLWVTAANEPQFWLDAVVFSLIHCLRLVLLLIPVTPFQF